MINAVVSETCTFLASKRPMFTQLSKTAAAALVLVVCSAAVTLSAQSVTTLLTFEGPNGSSPTPAMLQNVDGYFYGVTENGGGSDNAGTFFKMNSQGTLTTIYEFNLDSGGYYPNTALVRGIDGNFYGTTFLGGASPVCNGSVFKITPQGAPTTLYSFCSESHGELPEGSLVQSRDGNFYGTTYNGGSNLSGTVFKMTPQGKLTTIYNFCSLSHCTDGSNPSGPGMILGTNGNLYGTTNGADTGYGTVFSITPEGQLTTLYNFCNQAPLCADGRNPGPLIQATDGNFYGTASEGGASAACDEPGGCGTIFEITAAGEFSTLHVFCQNVFCEDGLYPTSLIQGSDGNLYGTTESGGSTAAGPAFGTIFRMTPDGTFTTLQIFCAQSTCPDGAGPGNLVQSVDGSAFGSTEEETHGGYGTIFRADDGLPPFVQILPPFGTVGATIHIFGSNLRSSTTVNFNGTPAAFTVVSDRQIEATVPTGASGGIITVVTDQGTLASNVVFSVVQ